MSKHQFSITQGRAATDSRISDTVYRTLAVLGQYADKDGWCWPSQSTMAEERGLSRQTINEHIAFLCGLGYVQKRQRFSEHGGQTSNMYRLLYDSTPPVEPEPTPPVEQLPDTNDPLNDPSNNTANDEKSVVADLPIEWQIAAGKEITKMPDNNDAKYVDAANLIAMSFGGQAEQARGIALAFMRERKILIPNSKIKAQRKAVKEMLEMGVRADHVAEAVWELQKNNMTIVDLYSVSKTAINLANLDAGSQTHSKFEGV